MKDFEYLAKFLSKICLVSETLIEVSASETPNKGTIIVEYLFFLKIRLIHKGIYLTRYDYSELTLL